MNLEILEQDSHITILLKGEIDLHNAKNLKAKLLAMVERKKALALDFSMLSYIDSSGMATMVEAFNLSKKYNIDFAIVSARGAPLQVLKLTRLDSIFPMFDSVEAFIHG